MRKKFMNDTAMMAVALAMTTPAHAQLIGGLVGGLGGALPTRSVAIGGDIAVSNGADTAIRQTRSDPRVARHGVVPVVERAYPRQVVVVPEVANLEVRRRAIIAAGIAPITYQQVPAYVDNQYVVFRDELRGTGVRVHRQGQQIVLEMPSDVTFAFNKSDVQPRFFGVLDAVSRTLAHYPATYVDVYGHTDAIGSYSYNQVLSEKRADHVADFLVARAVNPGRLHVEGLGKTEPIASNSTIQGRAANRRVEIVLTPYAA